MVIWEPLLKIDQVHSIKTWSVTATVQSWYECACTKACNTISGGTVNKTVCRPSVEAHTACICTAATWEPGIILHMGQLQHLWVMKVGSLLSTCMLWLSCIRFHATVSDFGAAETCAVSFIRDWHERPCNRQLAKGHQQYLATLHFDAAVWGRTNWSYSLHDW